MARDYEKANMLGVGYGGAELVPSMPRHQTRREQLLERKQYYAEQIVLIDEGLKLLERNPDIEQLLEILGRV